ncbi:MAG: DUF1996 domain-containing protein [Caldilineaceae bacterium]
MKHIFRVLVALALALLTVEQMPNPKVYALPASVKPLNPGHSALTPRQQPPLEAQVAGPIGEFVAFCPFSHRLQDDPIVFPGEAGKSHSHEFFGNVTADANATSASLMAGATNCDPTADHSSYWAPTLFDAQDQPVAIEQATFYYLVHVNDPTTVQPFPVGLKIIAGNAKASTPEEAAHIKWSCLGAPDSSTGDFIVCPADSKLELLVNYPDCWNGQDLDSADHKSHMAYSEAGACPATHPVVVPALQFKLRYAFAGEAGMRLASGTGYTAHADFFNAWDPAALTNRIRCLHELIKCGAAGYPQPTGLDYTLFLPFIDQP